MRYTCVMVAAWILIGLGTVALIAMSLLAPAPKWLEAPGRRDALRNRLKKRHALVTAYLILAAAAGIVLMGWALVNFSSRLTEQGSALVRAALWPLAVFAILIAFGPPLRDLLRTAVWRSVRLKVLGLEFELTKEQAKEALSDLLAEISNPVNGLKEDEKRLFEAVLEAGGRKRVDELLTDFRRDTPSHDMLRRLRDLQLIRPLEGSRWKADKHPVPTRFGQIVHEVVLRTKEPAEKT